MKRLIATILMITVFAFGVTGCQINNGNNGNTNLDTDAGTVTDSSNQADTTEPADGKLKIVTTIFPYYDFVRQIAGELADVTMLVPTGKDTHSFEPTPADMITIQNADIFVYNGGEMESWVEQVLESVENDEQIRVRMMDFVVLFEEELVEGMEAGHEHEHAEGEEHEEEEHSDEDTEEHEDSEHIEGEEHEHEEHEHEEVEYDEHIWTSPVNAEKLVVKLSEVIASCDTENEAVYTSNAEAFQEKLRELDQSFEEVVNNATYKTLVFGDKFPLRYFVEEYGLDYSAAFSGCSTETEPSAETIAFLINKVKEDKIPVVYHLELSNGKVAETICESTGAKKLQFNSCHNVTQEQFDSGITYLELMEQNVEALKQGIN